MRGWLLTYRTGCNKGMHMNEEKRNIRTRERGNAYMISPKINGNLCYEKRKMSPAKTQSRLQGLENEIDKQKKNKCHLR